MQQMGLTPPGQPLIPGQVPAVVSRVFIYSLKVVKTVCPYLFPPSTVNIYHIKIVMMKQMSLSSSVVRVIKMDYK